MFFFFSEERDLNVGTIVAQPKGEGGNFRTCYLHGHSSMQRETCSIGNRSCRLPGIPDDKGHAQNIALCHQYASAGIAAEGWSQLYLRAVSYTEYRTNFYICLIILCSELADLGLCF